MLQSDSARGCLGLDVRLPLRLARNGLGKCPLEPSRFVWHPRQRTQGCGLRAFQAPQTRSKDARIAAFGLISRSFPKNSQNHRNVLSAAFTIPLKARSAICLAGVATGKAC